jgi:hypothetical protein
VEWGSEVPLKIGCTGCGWFKVQLPTQERSPFNVHFEVEFKDAEGRGCRGVVMELRKHCGAEDVPFQVNRFISI